jgi:hypothetical protein
LRQLRLALRARAPHEPIPGLPTRRLRYLGLIKRITGTYRYHLTRIGRSALAARCRLAEQTIIPALA